MDTRESTQNTKDQEIPGVFPYRLRDREQLRKRKLEAQEQKSSQEKSKTKRGRKAKASGTSSKLPKEPEPVPELEPKPEPESKPEPEPVLEPVPLQEEEEEEVATDKVAELSLEREKLAPLQESVNLSTTGDLAATLTDGLGENTRVKIQEILALQVEDVPGENPPFEKQIILSI
ncbi:protein TonB-like isoform X2 [Amblyraja radiata]|uniref:protein TonB-like isoform X2 n=1 Tax=Amblyraja radiata TaxID=386614 RepID=UPI001403A153|nr:protein TonB-like isoform X2 [Amblyraja radiata]